MTWRQGHCSKNVLLNSLTSSREGVNAQLPVWGARTPQMRRLRPPEGPTWIITRAKWVNPCSMNQDHARERPWNARRASS